MLIQKDKIKFIYNYQQIIYEEYTTIGQYFQKESNINIFVNDIYNLFSINWNQTKNITFQVNQSFLHKFTFINSENLDSLLREYLKYIDHP